MLAVACVGGTAVDVEANIEPLRHHSRLCEDLSRVVGLQPQGDRDMLMASTPLAYPQVFWRRFA